MGTSELMLELYAAGPKNLQQGDWWGEELNAMQAAEPAKCQKAGEGVGK